MKFAGIKYAAGKSKNFKENDVIVYDANDNRIIYIDSKTAELYG